RIDYLRPAVGNSLAATALVRRAGRTIAVVDVEATDDAGRLVAIGRGCYSTKVGETPIEGSQPIQIPQLSTPDPSSICWWVQGFCERQTERPDFGGRIRITH